MSVRSSIESLRAYVPGEQPSGPEVLKLNTNENPYPPSPKVFEAMGNIGPDTLRKYPHPTGRELREAIADLHGLTPEQALVCNGSDEGLALCTRAFCEHRGRVGYLSPSYSLYPVLADIAELEKVEFPLEPDFSWRPPEVLDVDLFFLTQPNAPTSRALPMKEVSRAAERCAGVLLVDEAYVDFADETAVPLIASNENMLVSRTFSKSYSLAGLRMGYLLGPENLIGALYKIKDSYNTDVVSQRLALAALRDPDWTRANILALRGTREAVAKELEKRGFTVLPSQTNFLFAEAPEGRDAARIFEGLKKRQVYIRYFPGELTGRYLRVTIGTDAQMDRFLRELDLVLKRG